MKEYLVDDPPRYISGIEFGVLSPQEIIKQAEVEIATRDLYDLEKGRIPKEHGAIDMRMVCLGYRKLLRMLILTVIRVYQMVFQNVKLVMENWLLARDTLDILN